MKIGLVLASYDPSRGGVEQWTHQFVLRLLDRKHEVHVIASEFGTVASDLPIRQYAIPDLPTRAEKAAAIEKIVDGLHLDIVHDMGVGWSGDVFQPHGGSRLAAARQNLLMIPSWLRPIKAWIDPQLPRNKDFDELLKKQYSNPNSVYLALSRMVQRDLQELHGIPEDRIRLIYNGVDLERFTPANRNSFREETRNQCGVGKDDVLFLIVAHNLKLKGVPALIQALGRLPNNAKLAVVGGKRTRSAARIAAHSGVSERVTFVGSVDDPTPYYAAADAYVQPTFYDPCSLVVLEALAAGLPVITSRFNGAGELMTPEEHGYLVDDPADIQSLADAMHLMLDTEHRRWMSHAARELMLEHSFEHNVEEILDVYRSVIARKNVVNRQRAA